MLLSALPDIQKDTLLLMVFFLAVEPVIIPTIPPEKRPLLSILTTFEYIGLIVLALLIGFTIYFFAYGPSNSDDSVSAQIKYFNSKYLDWRRSYQHSESGELQEKTGQRYASYPAADIFGNSDKKNIKQRIDFEGAMVQEAERLPDPSDSSVTDIISLKVPVYMDTYEINDLVKQSYDIFIDREDKIELSEGKAIGPRVSWYDSSKIRRYRHRLDPKIIIFHYATSENIDSYLNHFRQNEKHAPHFAISRRGEVLQFLRADRKGYHTKNSDKFYGSPNDFSIGIVLINWGKLSKRSDGTWMTWQGKPLSGEHVIEDPGARTAWDRYPPEQIAAAYQLAKALKDEYNLEGVFGDIEHRPQKTPDPGHHFPMKFFRSLWPPGERVHRVEDLSVFH